MNFSDDPISTVESIRVEYQAVQELTQQEIKLWREACEKKSQQVHFLYTLNFSL